MKNYSSGKSLASLLAALFLVACGDGENPGRSGIDDGTDAGADAVVPVVSNPDSSPTQLADAQIPHIIAEPDGSSSIDAAPDAPGADGGDLRGIGGADPPDDASILEPTADRCRDGARGLTEECDDGNTSNTDACLSTCRVRDMRVLEDTPPAGQPFPNRVLGQGRHPVAAGSGGFAVAFVETSVSAVSVELEPKVVLAHFNPKGTRGTTQWTHVSNGTTPLLFADPVVAALPTSGVYAVAWTELDGDGDALGVALRRVTTSASPPVLSAVTFANASTLFSQSQPDILWTGTEVVVGWIDDTNVATGPDILYRRFDQNLTPIDATDQTLAATDSVEDGLAFGNFKGGWAAAWRENSPIDGRERIVVRHAAVTWQTDYFQPGPADDRPALVELDSTHLLVVFSVGTDPWGDGIYDIPKTYGAVLNLAAPGTASSMFRIFPEAPGDQIGPTLDQSHPNAVRVSVGTNTRYYVASRGEFISQDEVALKPILWNATTQQVDVTGTALTIPRETASNVGDQRYPALAGSTLAPQGAIVAAWDDLYKEPNVVQGEPDVRVELIPVPIVRKP